MTTRKELVRVCDICKKRVSDDGEIQFGGNAHSGWFSVEQTGGSTMLSELQKQREWDVCGMGCLRLLVAQLGGRGKT